MKRALLTTMSTLVLACLTATTASAQNVHNKRGPTCADNGLTASCTGTLAGLGNFDILVKLSTTGAGDTTCTNPGGNSKVPGQNPGIPIPNITGIQVIPASNVKNGNAPYTVSTQVPADPTPAAAGCPNNSWTATWSNISFAGITAGFGGTSTLFVFQCIGGTYNAQGVCSAGGPNGNDGTQVLATTIP
jgi:hypothetical protein